MKIIRSNDYKTLTNIWLRASIEAHSFIERSFWEDQRSDMECKYLPSADNYALASDSGRIMGFVSLRPATIEALFIDLPFQGKDLGSELIRLAKKQFPHSLSLEVYEQNQRAIRFYSRHGFVTDGPAFTDLRTGAAGRRMIWLSEQG